jgi:hypothetical protein
MTYGGTVPTIVPQYAGLTGGDTGPATPPSSCSTTATSSSPVGSYPTTCTQDAADPKYTITYQPGSVTVNPAPLTITASSPSMTYGAAVPSIVPQYSGLVNGDSAPASPPSDCSTTATSSSDVGPYQSSCTNDASDSNYNIGYATGSVSVGARGLQVTCGADPSSITVGETANYTATPVGFVNGDTWATAPQCTSDYVDQPGDYQITFSVAGDAGTNYSVTRSNGLLTVNPL